MAYIFYLRADYGLNITYEWNNKITESLTGMDYCNAQWLHPLAKINFSQAWFDQARYDYLVNFYAQVHGNRDIFLVEDPADCTVTHTPLNNLGLITRGVIRSINGQLQLCKLYQLGSNSLVRPITRIRLIDFYTQGGVLKTGVSVDVNTGIVTGADETDTWEGSFYIPMRFENDSFPIEIKGYDETLQIATYSLPDLRMTEEKESALEPNQVLLPNYNHYLQIPTQIGTQFDTKTKTDIFVSESGYTERDSLESYRLTVAYPEFTATQTEVNYLIGLQRLCLGEYSNIKYLDVEGDIDIRCRFQNPLSYTTLVDDDGEVLFNVNSLNLIQDETFSKSTYCYVWRIIRKDNVEVWFTNHDRALSISGNVASPIASPVATSANKTTELKPDSNELTAVFGLQISETDLINKVYDYAELQVSLYDWFSQTFISRLFTGNLGGFTIGYLANKAKQYTIEATSLTDRLDSSRTVQTSSQCRHKFLSVGYGNCNLSPLGKDDPDYVGMSCNKTIEACQSYNNVVNFGGQPRLPGIDETISRPE